MFRMGAASAISISVIVGGCASLSAAGGARIQHQLKCGQSVAEVEAIAGARLQPVEGRAAMSHVLQSGLTEMWFEFRDGALRASRIMVVTGLKSLTPEPWVSHCGDT
jgi:hypothetical protein